MKHNKPRNCHWIYELEQRLANIFFRGPDRKCLGFVGHTFFVATIQFCFCCRKVVTQSCVSEWVPVILYRTSGWSIWPKAIACWLLHCSISNSSSLPFAPLLWVVTIILILKFTIPFKSYINLFRFCASFLKCLFKEKTQIMFVRLNTVNSWYWVGQWFSLLWNIFFCMNIP